MNVDRQEFSAPWGRLLKGMSGGVVVLFMGIAAFGNTDGMILSLPLFLILALPFMIRGYVVSEGMLVIRRLGWETKIPLDNLQSLDVIPHAMHGAIRLFGNGGLFSITGLYRSKALGNFRAFVTDLNHTVVLHFPGRTVVISPDDPTEFIDAVKRLNCTICE